MLKKLIAVAGLLGGLALFSGQVMAEELNFGPCTPTNGTHVFNPTINKAVTDVSQNVKGATFVDFSSWDLGGSYTAFCECPDDTLYSNPVYFRAEVPLTFATSVGGRNYYQVNNSLAVATDVWISGAFNQYVGTPFDNISNLEPTRSQCIQNESTSKAVWWSGGKGKISLYILQPFVGETIIPSTKIIDIYASKAVGQYNSIPVASVYISGSVTVPQGCELSSGSTLEIPFGEFKSSDFKDRKGLIPSGATKYTKELQFKCTNISDGVKIYLRIEGKPNTNDTNAIDMGNADIGAVIEGNNGNIMIPNDSTGQEMNVSTLVDETHRVATTTITAYPISTTGKAPAAGEFEGIATMRIDVE